MEPFCDRKATKPLGFDSQEMTWFLKQNKNDNDSLESFINVDEKLRTKLIVLPLHEAVKKFIPAHISLEAVAYYYSQHKGKNENILIHKAKKIIDDKRKIELPAGVIFKNLNPIIHYQEAYVPIVFNKRFIGAVYEIVLENQFPRVVPTENIFAHNERYKGFFEYIQEEIGNKLLTEEFHPDEPVADLYGSAKNEETYMRTIPEIFLHTDFITEYFSAKQP